MSSIFASSVGYVRPTDDRNPVPDRSGTGLLARGETRYATAASFLILSGRKPDQCWSPATTTGAWR